MCLCTAAKWGDHDSEKQWIFKFILRIACYNHTISLEREKIQRGDTYDENFYRRIARVCDCTIFTLSLHSGKTFRTANNLTLYLSLPDKRDVHMYAPIVLLWYNAFSGIYNRAVRNCLLYHKNSFSQDLNKRHVLRSWQPSFLWCGTITQTSSSYRTPE